MTNSPHPTTIRRSLACRTMLAERLARLRARGALHPVQQVADEDAIRDLARHDAAGQDDALTTARIPVLQLEAARGQETGHPPPASTHDAHRAPDSRP